MIWAGSKKGIGCFSRCSKPSPRGPFRAHCGNGMSKDWKAWDGTCWGYEGFLVDNYYTLLAVLDREAALARAR